MAYIAFRCPFASIYKQATDRTKHTKIQPQNKGHKMNKQQQNHHFRLDSSKTYRRGYVTAEIFQINEPAWYTVTKETLVFSYQ